MSEKMTPEEARELRIETVKLVQPMGWSIIRTGGGDDGKLPRETGWTTQEPRPLDEVIQIAKEDNIGVSCGPTDLVAVDLDTYKPGAIDPEFLSQLTPTTTLRTARDGTSRVYRAPEWKITNSPIKAFGKKIQNVDVRGVGGQILLPGSVNKETGGVYEWEPGFSPHEVPPAPWPFPRFDDEAPSPPPSDPGSVEAATNYGKAALKEEAHRISETEEGGRNEQLNGSAFAIGQLVAGGEVDEHEAEGVLVRAAMTAGLPKEEAAKTVRSGLEAGKQKPRVAPPKRARGRPEGRYAILQPFSEIEEHDVEWLWRPVVPQSKVTIVAGQPGMGKSFTTIDIAARVSRGLPFPLGGEARPPGDVLILSAEDDPEDTIRPRLRAAGADLERVILFRGASSATETSDVPHVVSLADIDVIEDALAQRPDIVLITVDPISSFLGAGVDSNRNADVRRLLHPLTELAARYGVAVLAVTHLSKSNQGGAQERIIESTAFTAVARSVWLLCKDAKANQRRLLLPVKANLGPDPQGFAWTMGNTAEGFRSPTIEWEPEHVEMTADEGLKALQGSSQGGRAWKRNDCEEWLREFLADGPVRQKDIMDVAAKLDFSKKTVERAALAIGVQKTKSGLLKPTYWVWGLPE